MVFEVLTPPPDEAGIAVTSRTCKMGVIKSVQGTMGCSWHLILGRAPSTCSTDTFANLSPLRPCFLLPHTLDLGLPGCTCAGLKGAGPTIALFPFHSEPPESVRVVRLACVLVSWGSWVFTFGSLVCGQVGWFPGLRYDHLVVLGLPLRLWSGWAGAL